MDVVQHRGKPYDATTGLYNYGYRDYKPEAARFMTVDPIRDGNNWFAYVNNDPVNWRDPWGLNASDVLEGGLPTASILGLTNDSQGQSLGKTIANDISAFFENLGNSIGGTFGNFLSDAGNIIGNVVGVVVDIFTGGYTIVTDSGSITIEGDTKNAKNNSTSKKLAASMPLSVKFNFPDNFILTGKAIIGGSIGEEFGVYVEPSFIGIEINIPGR
jgi:RHS repeat-associated protein